jgi:large subunit ribosomal protein L30
MANLKITLVRSVIGRPQKQREMVKALGLGRVNSTVVLPDNAATRGVLTKLNHLIAVEVAD